MKRIIGSFIIGIFMILLLVVQVSAVFDDIQSTWEGTNRAHSFDVSISGTYIVKCEAPVPIHARLRSEEGDTIVSVKSDQNGVSFSTKLKVGAYTLTIGPVDSSSEFFDYSIHTHCQYTMTVGDYKVQIDTDAPNECAIVKYRKNAANVIIPETLDGRRVTNLLSEAFLRKTELKSVTIPSSVKTIGKDCFYRCGKLSDVVLSEGLEEIGSGAFECCASLKEIKIPQSVAILGSSCFQECSSLETVNFADSGLIEIGHSCFQDCDSLRNITIPASVTTMGTTVFESCYNLESITFLNTLEKLPSRTFLDCGYLCSDEIIWPKGLKVIGDQAFRNCDSFTALVIPNGVTMIGDYAFYACDVNELFLPSTLTEIGGSAFSKCNIIDTLVIPEGVIKIGGNAFTDNPNIEEVYIPSTVKEIGSHAFRRCTSLSSAVFYTVDTDIEDTCFMESPLVTMYVYPDSSPLKFAREEHISYVLMQNSTDDESPDDNIGEYIPPEETVRETYSAFQVYEPKYDYVREFTDNYTTVYHNGAYSVIDVWNNHYNQSEKDEIIGNYSENFVSILNETKEEITFHNRNGYTFTLEGYVWCDVFKGGKCAVMNSDGLYGMIDKDGHLILECMYDDIQYDASDVILVYADSSWTSIKLEQSTYSLRTNVNTIQLYDPTLSVTGEHIIASDGTSYAILTLDEIPITTCQYDRILDAHNGLFIGYYDNFVDLIQLDGTITATFPAYYVGEYSEDKLAVYNGMEFYYVDKTGVKILDVNIDDVVSVDDFHESYAVVNVNGKGYTYIDSSGEMVVDSFWDYAARFANGYALVMNYLEDNDGNITKKWSIIDTSFNVQMILDDDVYIETNDKHSTDFSNGYVRTIDRHKNLMGFIRLDNSISDGVETLKALKIGYVNLTLQESIAINFKIAADFFTDDAYKFTKAEFTFNGATTPVMPTIASDGKYVFTYNNVGPHLMGEDIVITVYAKDPNGNEVTATARRSIATYSFNMIKKYENSTNASDIAFRTMAVDLLKYGAAAQKYKDANVAESDLVTSILVGTHDNGTAYDYTVFASSSNEVLLDKRHVPEQSGQKVIWKAASLWLSDAVEIRLKIVLDSASNVTKDSLYVKASVDAFEWTVPASDFVETTDGYYVYLSELNPAQMRDLINVTVYTDTSNEAVPDQAVSVTLTYSIDSYVATHQNNDSLTDMLNAMLIYGDSAKAYIQAVTGN